jgi:hypothetical protein
MEERQLYRKALEDPTLDIECIIPKFYSRLRELVAQLPAHSVVSEWSYGGRYEYHVHQSDVGASLRDLFDQGHRAGNPRLIQVYSIEKLMDLTQEALSAH